MLTASIIRGRPCGLFQSSSKDLGIRFVVKSFVFNFILQCEMARHFLTRHFLLCVSMYLIVCFYNLLPPDTGVIKYGLSSISAMCPNRRKRRACIVEMRTICCILRIMNKQEAQLSQRDRATLRVIKYFAKSLKVIRNEFL